MRLDEALRETGKARREGWRPLFRHIMKRGTDELSAKLWVEDAIATDWEPYHDPPIEKRLRRATINEPVNAIASDCWQAVEVSPERDEIVRAAVEWMEFWRKEAESFRLHWEYKESSLKAAVEAWERAGRPA